MLQVTAAAEAAHCVHRVCSVGFHLAPYKGAIRRCTPDLLDLQQLGSRAQPSFY